MDEMKKLLMDLREKLLGAAEELDDVHDPDGEVSARADILEEIAACIEEVCDG